MDPGKPESVTIGIDLATRDRNMGAVAARWMPDGPTRIASVSGSDLGAEDQDDSRWVDWLRGEVADVNSSTPICIAIDAPFGWPEAWREAIVDYSPGSDFGSWGPEIPDTKDITWRATDRVVASAGRTPQRVAASWLGSTATRCAFLLASIQRELGGLEGREVLVRPQDDALISSDAPRPIEVIETYPRAVRDVASNNSQVEALFHQLDVEREDNEHVRDARICAAVARLYLQGKTRNPEHETENLQALARSEGWIYLPRG